MGIDGVQLAVARSTGRSNRGRKVFLVDQQAGREAGQFETDERGRDGGLSSESTRCYQMRERGISVVHGVSATIGRGKL